MRILALDYGRARVGLAYASGKIAEPLMVLPHDEQLIPQLLVIIKKEKIETVVLGLSENQMAQETKKFGALLAQYLDIPLIYSDETLTSHQVKNYLQALPWKKRQGPIDHYAATLILQNYLDERG